MVRQPAELAYVPTNASFLNRIECHFTALRYFALNGTDHHSHEEQNSMIRRYIAWRNRNKHDKELRAISLRAKVADAAPGVVESGSQLGHDLIAGLVPRAQGVTDPELATALAERDRAMEDRARTLAAQAVEAARPWVAGLGNPPSEPARRQRWLRKVSTVAAYRDRWQLTSPRPLGAEADVTSIEQQTQRQRAQAAIQRAVAISRADTEQPASPVLEFEVQVQRGVER